MLTIQFVFIGKSFIGEMDIEKETIRAPNVVKFFRLKPFKTQRGGEGEGGLVVGGVRWGWGEGGGGWGVGSVNPHFSPIKFLSRLGKRR